MQKTPPAHGLQRISPGLYVDGFGVEYFYLTGFYARVTKSILENPVLSTPAFIADVLDELRCELKGRYCVELMD